MQSVNNAQIQSTEFEKVTPEFIKTPKQSVIQVHKPDTVELSTKKNNDKSSNDKTIAIAAAIAAGIAAIAIYAGTRGRSGKSSKKIIQNISENAAKESEHLVQQPAAEKAVKDIAKQTPKTKNPYYVESKNAVESAKNGSLKYDVETAKKQEALKKAEEAKIAAKTAEEKALKEAEAKAANEAKAKSSARS